MSHHSVENTHFVGLWPGLCDGGCG